MDKTALKNKLSPEAYAVCVNAATERPFTGKYTDHFEQGSYLCVCCDRPLFESETKFQSGCGWPSFFAAIAGAIDYRPDHSHGMNRIEIVCHHCQSHLGHVFDDGPAPTGKRYCVNSVSLHFQTQFDEI